MNKLTALYQCFTKERDEKMQEQLSGGEAYEKFNEFLKAKLSAGDYFQAEALLNEVCNAKEKDGFTSGARYTTELFDELRGKEKE